ncbi:MAG: enoyl-CoA hydratase/isomerase family protein [Nocardioides sp.]|nr:enoyl-CoA hydratase/isomerase family protein [Nocardioides sp.]
MSEPMVLNDVVGAVQVISLNRPDRLNAMTKGLVDELLPVLETAAADPAVRCVVLTGVGRGFCAGGDLGEIGDLAVGVDVAREEADLRRLHRSSVGRADRRLRLQRDPAADRRRGSGTRAVSAQPEVRRRGGPPDRIGLRGDPR